MLDLRDNARTLRRKAGPRGRIAAVLLLAVAGCSESRPASPESHERLTDVAVAAAQSSILPDWLEAIGTVRAIQTADVASQISGNILEVRVHEGDRVRAGQLLAVIDDAVSRTAVDQAIAAQESAKQAVGAAESDYALAAATQERYQALYEKKEISAMQYDQVKTRAQSAQAHRDLARAEANRATASLAEARVLLSHSRVEAPFAGLVTQKDVDPGTFAAPGTPLFTLENTNRYRLEATLNESEMAPVRLGSRVDVMVDALGSSDLSGKVSQIVPAADPASRSFLVKIDLPSDSRLRSGLFGRARFPRGTRSALMIPRSAVIERGQMQAVYVLDAGNIATLRYVTTGNALGQLVEVLSGLASGERVAAAPGDRQLAGKRIEPRP